VHAEAQPVPDRPLAVLVDGRGLVGAGRQIVVAVLVRLDRARLELADAEQLGPHRRFVGGARGDLGEPGHEAGPPERSFGALAMGSGTREMFWS
jgi:hypothetical protein